MSGKIEFYSTCLRDGGQRKGISYSVLDKLAMIEKLDQFGMDYIEAGWPGSNPIDTELFERAKRLYLQNARLVAFGMTCAKGKKPKDDEQLAKLLAAGTEVVTLVVKSSKYQVEKVLCVDLEENLRMIRETCDYLVNEKGKTIFVDAEHFFDGYKADSGYSMDCLHQAAFGGASRVILCDTNGGSLPWDVVAAVRGVKHNFENHSLDIPLGIHAHNDGALGVAISLEAVRAGATQVQGTVNGFGERVGNADLIEIIASLQLKMGIHCVTEQQLQNLTDLSRFVYKTANITPDTHQPYVGAEAFGHKGGIHASAVGREKDSYNHVNPELVGNEADIVVSGQSGRSNIDQKARSFGLKLSPEQTQMVLEKVKEMEAKGFQFDAADGSVELMMLKSLEGYRPPFQTISRRVLSEEVLGKKPVDSATVRICINDGESKEELYVADGDGPVNAMDNAIRKALLPKFPCIEQLKLVNYDVRDLDIGNGSAKLVRVLIDFEWGGRHFTTVGCSTDLVGASFYALLDGFEYTILKHK